MSGKNQYPQIFYWQSTDPRIGFRPIQSSAYPSSNPIGAPPAGSQNGVMTGATTIWSQIVEKSRMDNINLEVAWTGSAVGVFSILTSNSGVNWNALTFSPVLAQPAGADGGYSVNITLLSAKFILLQYVNASSVGVLTVNGQFMDVN